MSQFPKSQSNINYLSDFTCESATIHNLTTTNLTGTNLVSSTSIITSNALVKGDTGSKDVKTSGVLCDSSNNLTGMGNITMGSSGVLQNNNLTKVGDTNCKINMNASTPAILVSNSNGAGAVMGVALTSNLNKHLSFGIYGATNRGLIYSFDQGGGSALGIEYGFPGFPVVHNFYGSISSTSTVTGTNLICTTVNSLTPCGFQATTIKGMICADISSTGSVLVTTGGISSVSKSSTGLYTITLNATSTYGATANVMTAGLYNFITLERQTSASYLVVIRTAGGVGQDADFSFSCAYK